MRQTVKIQINSLQALERLIGGDSELEIEIRNSVAQDFSKKYLKSQANEFSEKLISKEFRNELQVCLKGLAKQTTSWGLNYELDNKYKQLIHSEIDEVIHQKANELIKPNEILDKLKQTVTDNEIYINRAITDYLDKHLKDLVNRTVNDMVTKILKQ